MIDRQALRGELERTRRAYHELLTSVPREAWERKSGNSHMTVKQLMWHTAWAMSWMAGSIESIRSGKSLRAPGFLIEPGRKVAMWWLARGATPQAAARKYDEGHARVLEKLAALGEDDFARSASRWGVVRTVEWCVRHPMEHFEEHAADVRAVLPEPVS